jgi:hypothetical protein
MAALLDQPALQFFTSYRDDFSVHDRRELTEFGAPGNTYLWVVGESGTHLTRLGIHTKHDEWMRAVLEQVEREKNASYKVYFVSMANITEIDVPHARQLLAREHDYSVTYASIMRKTFGDSKLVADYRLTWDGGWAKEREATVRFDAPEVLGAEDVTALRILANNIVVIDARSLFAKLKSIQINGLDISVYLAGVRGGRIRELLETPTKQHSGHKVVNAQRALA